MTNKFLQVSKDYFKLGLNPTEILVLSQVAEYNRTTGDCFISDNTMAEMFGVSAKTISRALAVLEDKKLIKRETKNVKGGKERHIYLTTDKMTVDSSIQPTNCPLTTDNLSIDNGQNDLIKENIKEKRKDNIVEINQPPVDIISPTHSPKGEVVEEYKQVSKREMIAYGVPYEVVDENKNLYRIIATNKIVRAV